MAKQDVLDAINATIAPNGIKGITAESLNNILTMMTENAGEGGSGDGALRVIVPEMMMIGPEFISIGEFSPTSWEEMKSLLEQEMGVDFSEYDAAVKASFEHNANVAQQILEKAKAGQGVSVILDQTLFEKAYLNVLKQMDPSRDVVYEDYIAGSSQFASYRLEYVKLTPEGEAEFGISEGALLVLSPVRALEGSGGSVHYPESVLFNLQLDGSIVFEVIEEEQPSNGSGVVTFYVGEELTSEYKTKNAEAFSSFKNGSSVSLQIISDGEVAGTWYPCTVAKTDEEVFCTVLMYSGTLNTYTVAVGVDGSVTLELIQ